jgi:pteridine reductase
MTAAKVALATGAGQRLGREFALGLGRAGYAVAVHYRSDPAAATRTVALLNERGAPAQAFRADLAEDGVPRKLVDAVVARFGRLDALLHAASPWVEKPFLEVTAREWDDAQDVGPKALFLMAQAAAPALGAAEGAILVVSDVAALRAWPRHVPHAVAKAAMNALVVNLAVALAPAVRVNGVAPGIVLPPEDLTPEAIDRLVAKTPLRRRVAVEDVVAAAVALLENRSVTGQVLAVDAGRVLV